MIRLSAGFMAATLAAASLAGGAQAQDVARGGKLFAAQCGTCHSVANPPVTVMGPSLFRLVGRKAGTQPGFNYSNGMKNSGLVWTAAQLDAYLTAPKKTVPGLRMSYPGMPAAKDRADLIAFLATKK